MYLNNLQKEIVQAIAADVPVKVIADNYNQSYHAVSRQLELLRKRYECPTNVSLVVKALQSGQIEYPNLKQSA